MEEEKEKEKEEKETEKKDSKKISNNLLELIDGITIEEYQYEE